MLGTASSLDKTEMLLPLNWTVVRRPLGTALKSNSDGKSSCLVRNSPAPPFLQYGFNQCKTDACIDHVTTRKSCSVAKYHTQGEKTIIDNKKSCSEDPKMKYPFACLRHFQSIQKRTTKTRSPNITPPWYDLELLVTSNLLEFQAESFLILSH